MLDLSTITLVGFTTRAHEALSHAMHRCRERARFRNHVVITDKPDLFLGYEHIYVAPFVNKADMGVWGLIDLPPQLLPHIGDHYLWVDYDGFIANPAAWEPEFLDQDYIGAPYPWGVVGNSGFHLGSRHFLESVIALDLPRTEEACWPGDQRLCITYRDRLEAMDVKFALVDMAKRFSVECTPYVDSFGFHSLDRLREVQEMGLG